MEVKKFTELLGADFYTGVPDSQLKALCNYLMKEYGIDSRHHIIAANEGNCTALAAGYHLATGKVPVVYMQNSGEGNIINPVASLLNDKVYAIPCIFVIGWRGEPGVHDEPQHIYQGEITIKLLEDMGIDSFVISKDTSEEEMKSAMEKFSNSLENGKNVAFVVRKGALSYNEELVYENPYAMVREDVISHITAVTGEAPIVCTTGKASRELFEIRTAKGQPHQYDFLTVGSMGHSSSIALGIALNKRETKIWCIDGDGAALMHMGAMAVIGEMSPNNMVHIVLNNEAHETVGGMPTASKGIDLIKIAEGCGYKRTYRVTDFSTLDKVLEKCKAANELTFVEVKTALGARDNLGRPTTTAVENKQQFMSFLSECR